MSALARFWREARGATAVEYSFIAVVVSIAAVAALTLIGPAVANMLQRAADALF